MCRRTVTADGQTFVCAHPDLKRALSPAEALAYSCNDFFVSLAPRLSRDSLNRTRLAAGLAPIAAGTPMASALVGLAGPRTSPRALIDVMARLAGAGKDKPVPMSAATRAVLLDGLRGAAEYGTASALKAGGVSALAKTGTDPDAERRRAGPGGRADAGRPSNPRHGRRRPRRRRRRCRGDCGRRPVAAHPSTPAPRHRHRHQPWHQAPGTPGTACSTAWHRSRLGRTLANGRRGSRRFPSTTTSRRCWPAKGSRGRAMRRSRRWRSPPGPSPWPTATAIAARASTCATPRTARWCVPRPRPRPGPRRRPPGACCSTRDSRPLSSIRRRAAAARSRPPRSGPAPSTTPASRRSTTMRTRASRRGRATCACSDIERALRAAGLRGDRAARHPRAWPATSRTASRGFASTGSRRPRSAATSSAWRSAASPVSQAIKSTAFDIKRTSSGYHFRGRGFGHGVGLCVIGAGQRAVAWRDGRRDPEVLLPWPHGGRGSARVADHHDAPAAPAPRAAHLPSTWHRLRREARPLATDIALALPGSEERERGALLTLIRTSRDEVVKATGAIPPARLRVTVHPTVDSFGRATGQPWWVSGATEGAGDRSVAADDPPAARPARSDGAPRGGACAARRRAVEASDVGQGRGGGVLRQPARIASGPVASGVSEGCGVAAPGIRRRATRSLRAGRGVLCQGDRQRQAVGSD